MTYNFMSHFRPHKKHYNGMTLILYDRLPPVIGRLIDVVPIPTKKL